MQTGHFGPTQESKDHRSALFWRQTPGVTGRPRQVARDAHLAVPPTIDSGGNIIIPFGSDTNSYYILRQSSFLSASWMATHMTFGFEESTTFTRPTTASVSGFFQVQGISITQPADTDGDFIDEVWELLHPRELNPLEICVTKNMA